MAAFRFITIVAAIASCGWKDRKHTRRYHYTASCFKRIQNQNL